MRVSAQIQLQDKTKELKKAKLETKKHAEELERSNDDLQTAVNWKKARTARINKFLLLVTGEPD